MPLSAQPSVVPIDVTSDRPAVYVGTSAKARSWNAMKLMQQLLSAPRFGDKLRYQDIMSYGLEPVLLQVCYLVLEGNEPGIYRPDPAISDRVPALIASRLNRIGAEEQVTKDLETLIKLGLVFRPGDGGLALPLQVKGGGSQPRARLPSVHMAGKSRTLSDRGGRPRKGETSEQAKLRRSSGPIVEGLMLQEQRALRLLRTLEGGNLNKPVSVNLPVFEQNHSSDVVKTLSGGVLEVSEVLKVSLPSAAAAAFSNFKEFKQQQQPSVAAHAREETSVSKPVGLSQPHTDEISLDAKQLAAEAINQFGWSRIFAEEAPKEFQKLLNEGYTPKQFREAFAMKKGVSCRSAKYFIQVMRDKFTVNRASKITNSSDYALEISDSVTRNPAWSSLPLRVKAEISQIICYLDRPDGPERCRLLSFHKKHSQVAYQAAAVCHPELLSSA